MQLEGSSSSLNYDLFHSRCDSAPIDMPVRVDSTSPPRMRTHTPDHRHSIKRLSQQLLDPLVDFTPDQLNGKRRDLVSPDVPEDLRLSMAW